MLWLKDIIPSLLSHISYHFIYTLTYKILTDKLGKSILQWSNSWWTDIPPWAICTLKQLCILKEYMNSYLRIWCLHTHVHTPHTYTCAPTHVHSTHTEPTSCQHKVIAIIILSIKGMAFSKPFQLNLAQDLDFRDEKL